MKKSEVLSARHQAIISILNEKRFVTVSELASLLYVSEITVRRDLRYLESLELLRRSHGGAVSSNNISHDVSYALSLHTNSQEKKLIAEKAISLIPDSSTVFLDASSSARAMIPFLADRKDIFVFTHSLENALLAASYDMKVFCSGGSVKKMTGSCVGASTLKMLEGIHVDFTFFSSRGIGHDGLITHQSDDKCRIVQMMMAQSKYSYLLCDSSKADVYSIFPICRAEELTGVITDQPFPFDIPNTILA